MPFFSNAAVLLQVAATIPASTQPARFTEFSAPERVCEVTDREINEASGLVASRANPGVYYIHNDSGGKPMVYVIDRAGAIKAKIELIGATNVDWEDIAIAPGSSPNLWDVCVADIGDNNNERRCVTLYRFRDDPLPQSIDAKQCVTTKVSPATFEFRYEDGPRDAESLAIHPISGDGYVFQKRRDGNAAVYRIHAPWKQDGVQTLSRIGELSFPDVPPIQRIVTAADFSPDGRRLVARTYTCGWIWNMPAKDMPKEISILFRQTPERIDLAAEKQGEAICFSSDGRCLLTISEGSPTWLYECCDAESNRTDSKAR